MSVFKHDWWKDFDYDNKEHRQRITRALQFFCSIPNKFIPSVYRGDDANSTKFKEAHKNFHETIVKLQAFTTTGDFPASIMPMIEKFHVDAAYDNFYEQIFDIRDFSDSRRGGFHMLDVQSGLTFRKMKTGEKADVFQMSGESVLVEFDYYAGALGWHRKLFDDEEYWTVEDNAIEFRNKAYQNRAQTFYTMIEYLRTLKADIAWQPPTPAALPNTDPLYNVNRDAATMNLAAQTILLNCQNKGYGITAGNTVFIVLCPVQLRGRIRRALNIMQQAQTPGMQLIDYNFQQITTLMLQDTEHYYVILPKKKLKGGYRMDLRIFADFDILSYTDTEAGWMRYGGAIGDEDQIEACDIAV